MAWRHRESLGVSGEHLGKLHMRVREEPNKDTLDGRAMKERCVAKKDGRLRLNERDGKGDRVLQGAVENEEGLGRCRDCGERGAEGG